MRQLLPSVGITLLIVLAAVVGVAYVKFYNERTQNYYKHLYVLQYECQSGRQLPHIQYNLMTYDGTATNCTEAQVFTSIPPSLGAIHDMWVSSPFFALMYATDWKIQLAYVLFGVVAVIAGIRSHFSLRAQQAVLNTFSSNKRIVKSSLDDRPRMLVKVSDVPPMKALAKQLLADDEPVFAKVARPIAIDQSAMAL